MTNAGDRARKLELGVANNERDLLHNAMEEIRKHAEATSPSIYLRANSYTLAIISEVDRIRAKNGWKP